MLDPISRDISKTYHVFRIFYFAPFLGQSARVKCASPIILKLINWLNIISSTELRVRKLWHTDQPSDQATNGRTWGAIGKQDRKASVTQLFYIFSFCAMLQNSTEFVYEQQLCAVFGCDDAKTDLVRQEFQTCATQIAEQARGELWIRAADMIWDL